MLILVSVAEIVLNFTGKFWFPAEIHFSSPFTDINKLALLTAFLILSVKSFQSDAKKPVLPSSIILITSPLAV